MSAALREVFIDVEVGQSTVLLLLAALSHVGVVLVFMLNVFLLTVFLITVFLIDVFFCRLCHSCGICVENGLILVCGHSCDRADMIWTDRV